MHHTWHITFRLYAHKPPVAACGGGIRGDITANEAAKQTTESFETLDIFAASKPAGFWGELQHFCGNQLLLCFHNQVVFVLKTNQSTRKCNLKQTESCKVHSAGRSLGGGWRW